MTEEQIERRVEFSMDRLDHQFLNSPMTQDEYDCRVKELNQWTEEQYAKTTGAR